MNIFIWLTILFITTIVFGKENILFILSTLIISILLIYIYRKLSFRKILFYGILSLVFILCVDFIFNEVFEQRHRDRFDIVLGIKEDNRGIGYNTNQSQLAFKSGGFFGEGFLKELKQKEILFLNNTVIIFLQLLEKNGGFWFNFDNNSIYNSNIKDD